MDRRVMIMCDVRASGITGDVDDSYFVRVEPRDNGGALVVWSDLPGQAMVFDDAPAAAEFCRDSPLELFVVSFVPVSAPSPPAPAPPPPQLETEAEFRARLDRMVAEAGKAFGDQRESRPEPPPVPPSPKQAAELAEPGALSESLRRLGLM